MKKIYRHNKKLTRGTKFHLELVDYFPSACRYCVSFSHNKASPKVAPPITAPPIDVNCLPAAMQRQPLSADLTSRSNNDVTTPARFLSIGSSSLVNSFSVLQRRKKISCFIDFFSLLSRSSAHIHTHTVYRASSR